VALRIPDVHSLKAKRSVIRHVMTDLGKAFPQAGVAEVDHHDQWQRTTLGVALVAPRPSRLDQVVHKIGRFFEHRPDVELLSITAAYLDPDQ
jgi:uncharacterized protein YlxP (DUF503 family)